MLKHQTIVALAVIVFSLTPLIACITYDGDPDPCGAKAAAKDAAANHRFKATIALIAGSVFLMMGIRKRSRKYFFVVALGFFLLAGYYYCRPFIMPQQPKILT